MDRESRLVRKNVASTLAESAGRRFRKDTSEPGPRPEVNPYIAAHRAFGEEILPADEGRGLGERVETLFGRVAPVHLEIGSGNGFYLTGMAAAHPEWDFVGLEIRFKRVVIAAEKIRRAELRNARLVRYDAYLIEELFAPGALAGIHVNHPDPWARGKQAKRRLISPAFTATAAKLLAVGGQLRLKTDFQPHADVLLACIEGLPFRVLGRSANVLRDGAPWPDEVRTNYQRKADELGVPVHAVWLERTASDG
jgi:tRNA (guanine-N7-)-methyltransferase